MRGLVRTSVEHTATIKSTPEERVLVEAFPVGDVLLLDGTRHGCLESSDQIFVTFHGFFPGGHVG